MRIPQAKALEGLEGYVQYKNIRTYLDPSHSISAAPPAKFDKEAAL